MPHQGVAGAGIDLFSQAASRQVSSALLSLTSVFGMGTGGTSALYTPAIGDPCGNRTRVTGVRGRCLDRLTNGPWLASRLRRSVALRRRSLKGFATLWIRACVVFDDPSLRSGSSVMCACRRIFHVGAPSGTRTRDPLIKSQLLYQLS